MKTRNEIYYDLSQTAHTLNVDYGEQTIKYHFSSALYRFKFQQRMESNRKLIQESLSNRFGIDINSAIIADLRLYNMIEKRGYYIQNITSGGTHTCPETITLNGLKMTMKD